MGIAKNYATASLILGILSVITLGFALVPSILAIIFGAIALSKNKESPEEGVEGMATTGMVLGISIIVVMIGLLIYAFTAFTNFMSQPFIKEECMPMSETGINCTPSVSVSPNSNGIWMSITNSAGNNIKLTNITSLTGYCQIDYWNLDYNGSIPANMTAGLFIHCKDIMKGPFDDKFNISYMDVNNSLREHSVLQVVSSSQNKWNVLA